MERWFDVILVQSDVQMPVLNNLVDQQFHVGHGSVSAQAQYLNGSNQMREACDVLKDWTTEGLNDILQKRKHKR